MIVSQKKRVTDMAIVRGRNTIVQWPVDFFAVANVDLPEVVVNNGSQSARPGGVGGITA